MPRRQFIIPVIALALLIWGALLPADLGAQIATGGSSGDKDRPGMGGAGDTGGSQEGAAGGAGSRIGQLHYSYLQPVGANEIGIYALFQEQPTPDIWKGSGYVDIRYQDARIQADNITLYLMTYDIVAEGNVIFDLPGQRVTGDRAELNLLSGLGSIWDGSGFFDPGIYVHGKELEYYQKGWVRLRDCSFTSCDQPTPDWSFRVKKGRLEVERYAYLNAPAMRIKKLPILKLPYLVWPIKTKRSSGFLFPRIGTSSWRGFRLGGQYYWAISDSADATFTLDYYSKWGEGIGLETRYYAGEWGSGYLDGYLVRDKIAGTNRWKLEYDHVQDLLFDWRVGANVDLNSDFDFNRDFYNDFSNFSQRSTRAEVYASRSWSYYSLNGLAQTTKTVYTFFQTERESREVPTIDFEGRKQRLFGSPVYFEFETSYGNLSIQDYRPTPREFQRLDLSPAFSMPIKKIPWLKITPELGYRYTLYSHRVPLDKDGEGIESEDLIDEIVGRNYGFSQLALIGPSFSRIFNTPRNFFSKKFKHLIEPQISWNFISDIKNAQEIPYYDYGDRVLPVNELGYGIINRLFVKRKYSDSENSEPVTHELASLEISQKYSLDPDLNTSYGRRFNPYTGGYYGNIDQVVRKSPWQARLKISPSRFYSFDYEIYVNRVNLDEEEFPNRPRPPIFELNETYKIVQSRGSLRLRVPDRFYVNLSYSNDPIFLREQLMGGVGVELFNQKIKFEVSTHYDYTREYFPRKRGLLLYTGQCFSFFIEYLEYSYQSLFDAFSDRRIEAAINLTHIGDLFRFRDRTSPGGGSGPYD